MPANPALRFVDALNRKDIAGVEAVHHPEFEMIVPQAPARGFIGRDQEVKNIAYLFAGHPDARIEVLRMIEFGPEIWIETHLSGPELEMAAVMIYEIDPATDTLRRGRFYSQPVDRSAPPIDAFMESLDRERGRL